MSDKSGKGEGGRYPAAKGGVPMEDWVVERVFDSADYLDRKPPRYEGEVSETAVRVGAVTRVLLEAARAEPATSEETHELWRRFPFVAPREGSSTGAVSLKRDKAGLFVHTHRARSESFKSVAAIPEPVVRFIESTG